MIYPKHSFPPTSAIRKPAPSRMSCAHLFTHMLPPVFITGSRVHTCSPLYLPAYHAPGPAFFLLIYPFHYFTHLQLLCLGMKVKAMVYVRGSAV